MYTLLYSWTEMCVQFTMVHECVAAAMAIYYAT